MKNSLFILLIFSTGIAAGIFRVLPVAIDPNTLILYALYALLFLVGADIGGNPNAWKTLKKASFAVILVPISIVVGSLVGAGLFSLLLPRISVKDAVAIGAGFGYYSLSSIIITQIKGSTLGVIALLANLSREIITLIFAPLFVRLFGKLAPIASGGATAMDTTLPMVARFSGKEYAIIAFFSGIVLTVLVPILVPFILSL